ncbi:MAG: bifunctional glutamate N-acetyltransferase/amino-acid acetyltransferase ArgJ [Fibrobacteria bacterium]|nr:bifunctional glutamate N-acetyltransferase/amino-acid acetyltransferase ArgJ [Fibrobacteria bacterium]
MIGQNIHFPKGFSAWGLSADIKEGHKKDIGILESDPPAMVFGAFTINKFCAAPVVHCKKVLSGSHLVSHLVVNSGNANAVTGDQGIEDVATTVTALKEQFSGAKDILVSSTGVIGRPLPMDKITAGISRINKLKHSELDKDPMGFAESILTTDTTTKSTQEALMLNERWVRTGGVAKGSGMICPNMATMLAYITTDIRLPTSYKDRFQSFVEQSFNSMSVDGDMSTNDTVLLFSNGASGCQYEQLSGEDQLHFDNMLLNQFQSLAKQIVKDGEGATKFITININGAVAESHAKCFGKAIANSPLVKTAFFGNDPNWGRVIAAIGGLEYPLEPEKLDLDYCGLPVLRNGQPVQYNGKEMLEELKKKDVCLDLQLNLGKASWTTWTCDLSYDYVKINAEYHT